MKMQPKQFEPTPHPGVTIALVHGRWGSGRQYKPLRPYLEPYVGAVVTPDLAIEEPGLTYDDHAEKLAEALDDYDNIELWGHSRASEITTRVALRRPDKISRLGHICPRIPRAKNQPLPEGQPARLTERYRRWESSLGEELGEDDFVNFWKIMCGQSTEEEARWIFSTLRRQAPSPQTELIDHQPALPIDVVLAVHDGARTIEGIRADARAYPKVEPIEIYGDHYPHVNQPQFMARVILSRIGQPPFRYVDPKVLAPVEALSSSDRSSPR